jgi:hypothetical protein
LSADSIAPVALWEVPTSPCNFYFFTKLKSSIKGYHFQTHDSIQKAVINAFMTLTVADFQFCYEAWIIRWAKHVISEGCYFKGDSVDLDE